MSQQSINTIDYDSITKDVEKAILRSSNKKNLYNNFALGKEDDSDTIEHNSIMYDILKNANCHVKDLIQALQQPNFKKTKYKIKDGAIVIEDNSDQLYKIWLARGNSGTIENFFDSITQNTINSATVWEEVEW
jgi:hypothetical protein